MAFVMNALARMRAGVVNQRIFKLSNLIIVLYGLGNPAPTVPQRFLVDWAAYVETQSLWLHNGFWWIPISFCICFSGHEESQRLNVVALFGGFDEFASRHDIESVTQ